MQKLEFHSSHLRLGNFVLLNTTEKDIIQIKNSHLEEMLRVEGMGIDWRSYKFIFKPILLDYQWLEKKFKARNMKNGYWIPLTNLKSELHFEIFEDTDEIVTTIKGPFCDLILDRIKYVHELQNLYFALTKEEII